VPLWFIGKRREALTGNSEAYKKQVVRYLEKRGYYLKASSDVEATFPDCILTRKDEDKEYWLEAKATTISLSDGSFLEQLGKYLAEYLKRTRPNRFRMIIACYNVRRPKLFQQVFEKFDPEAIQSIIDGMLEVSESNVERIITKASFDEIRRFFEETLVIVANPLELEVAIEKIAPKAPPSPSLTDAEYATRIMSNFGDVEPLKGPDTIFLNLFQIVIPDKIYIGKTPYPDAISIFSEKPEAQFPAFRLEKGRIYTFNDMSEGSLLGEFVYPDSVFSIDLNEFDKDDNNRRIVIKLLNIWIKNKCKKMGLSIDKRTKAFYFAKKTGGYDPVIVVWTPKSKKSEREMTKPMMKNGKLNYWVHRAANIFARNYWNQYYIQIRPRWLFSPDGVNPYDGEKAAVLDRSFRKSLYNRNANRFYDVLFWYRYVFSETDVQGTSKLDIFYETSTEEPIKIAKQVTVQSDRRPFEIEEVEQFDKIELIPTKTLDEYFRGDE